MGRPPGGAARPAGGARGPARAAAPPGGAPGARGAPPEALAPEHARAILLRAAGFDRRFPDGAAGTHAVLDHLEWIQLDPIDRVGQNADLVLGARVAGVRRGEVHQHLRGASFEHFAKERCILHARHFPHYRAQAVETPWWRNSERMRKLDDAVLADVLAEVRERGPLPAEALTRRGRAEPMDWAGWSGTARREVLALEVLWTRCAVVVSGRDARGRRLVDVPERALPAGAAAPAPAEPFAEHMVLARVRTAGLLSRAGGPQWSMLAAARTDGTVERLLEDGRLAEVRVGKRPYLVRPADRDADPRPTLAAASAHAAVLGPLDPLIWDRALVRDAFGFDYLWEVYKPEPRRIWGYYVCPVLLGGQLRARIEARRVGGTLRVERSWELEPSSAVDEALSRLAALNACDAVDTSSCDRR